MLADSPTTISGGALSTNGTVEVEWTAEELPHRSYRHFPSFRRTV